MTPDGKVVVQLIARKSRVAPIKHTTIPRLELCAAVLLSKLIHRIQTSLKFIVPNTFLWWDFTILLSWIMHLFHHFVNNRVIQEPKGELAITVL